MGIYQCEIQGKRSRDDIKEDELTSRVFGLLNMIPHLRKQFFSNLGLNIKIDDQIKLWEKRTMHSTNTEVEPDLIVESTIPIVVENKLDAPLDENQLTRELNIWDDSILLVVTNNISKPTIISEMEDRYPERVMWINWRQIHTFLFKYQFGITEPLEKKLCTQTILLLERLGMTDFQEDVNRYHQACKNQLGTAQDSIEKFMRELRVQLKQEEGSLYQMVHDPHYGRLNDFWIDIDIKGMNEIDTELYSFINFDPETLVFESCFGSRKKVNREKWYNHFKKQDIKYTMTNDLKHDCIFYEVISTHPDFSDSHELTMELVKRHGSFVNTILSLLKKY